MDLFRTAIVHPGPPEDFALLTVQEAIKPQKQTKLAQDENQLLENILRTLLQELVLAAVQSGEQVMQYGQSVAGGKKSLGQIPRLLDIVLYLCEKEHIEGGMIFQLLEDLTEMSTMRNCEDIFGYIESKQEILGKPELFARGKLVMLRTCNQLLRRLSKANDVVFCGRIIMFLAHFFPLSERSAVNIKGVFNTSNETKYESEAPDGISIDLNFYKTLWSLQEYFSNPTSLTLTLSKWHKFTSSLTIVLSTFEAQPLSDDEGNAINLEDEAANFSIKYLTSTKLMGLELKDPNFRRHVLVQCLILFDYLKAPGKNDKDLPPETMVLSLLPPYDGKSILELGAGIGRFTGELAKKAGHLVALDFIESAIEKNESSNGHYKNAKFICADVTSPELSFPVESMDLIFSNWLLMYLSDEEVEALAERMVKWLKVGGHIFFRESCFHQSGDHKRKNNPTHYRVPRFYTKVFKECHLRDGSGNSFELTLVGCKCIGAYVRNKKNQNQICWVWQKVRSQDDRGFQRFLDNVQYKCNGILRYERVFGHGFVSTGGIETTREFVSKLDLQPGQKVLDVGCGIGGGDFYMADEYDVHVVGIDLSINMISFALERAIGLKCSVEFEVADCTKKTYPDGSFDVIYSRDTILHIQDKPALFKSFYKWLKPGGRVLISDYCKRSVSPSEDFAKYIKQRGYDLHDVEAYRQMLRDAGFDEVIAEDRTDQFIKVLQRELDSVEKDREAFIKDFSEEDYNDIVGGWKAKLIRSSSGEQRWGLFIAKKN